MALQLSVDDKLEIDGIEWRLAEHPSAPGMPYGQEGRQATVYQLVGAGEARALKVFKPRFRVPGLVALADKLAAFADLPGLTVCRRTVLTPQRHASLLRPNPDLTYAVLMPWIEGPTWMEVLLSGRELSPEQSLFLARSLADTLSALEQRSVAHCDLSGPNLLLPALEDSTPRNTHHAIELVDVEQLQAPGLDKPHLLPSGSFGYAHRTALQGLWQPDADRFAGAVLIAEMLGWCDPRVRRAAWGESYFDSSEMQQDCARYTVLRGVLERQCGEGPARLLDRVWSSDTLADCPTFGEWLLVLPEQAPLIASASPIWTDSLFIDPTKSALGAGPSSSSISRNALPAPIMPSAESNMVSPTLGDQAQPTSENVSTGNGTLFNELRPAGLADGIAGDNELEHPHMALSLDHLFNAGLAAHRQNDWMKAKELLGEVVRREPNYARGTLHASDLLANGERQITLQARAANGQGSRRRAWAVPILVLLALLTFGGIAVYQAQASATAQAQATATAQALAAAQTQQAGATATMWAGATMTAIAQASATFQAQATGTAQSLLGAATATAQAAMATQTVETAEAHAQQTALAVAAFATSTAEAQAEEKAHAQETETVVVQFRSATQTAEAVQTAQAKAANSTATARAILALTPPATRLPTQRPKATPLATPVRATPVTCAPRPEPIWPPDGAQVSFGDELRVAEVGSGGYYAGYRVYYEFSVADAALWPNESGGLNGPSASLQLDPNWTCCPRLVVGHSYRWQVIISLYEDGTPSPICSSPWGPLREFTIK